MKRTLCCSGLPRMDRLLHERIHDPYRLRYKPPDPTVCPACSAVFLNGRWQWAESWPLKAHREFCPACRRIQDNYPAGEVTLTGSVMNGQKPEILALVRHLEQLERTEHPLHRIMKIEERPERVIVSTTDLHLPRRIGEAVCRAYKGRLSWYYQEEACYLRAHWNSDG